jgi:CBS domain containing-hemolysin-like protein
MWLPYAPWLFAMGALLLCSAFFSAAEAAMFSLRRSQRREMAQGSTSQRVAAALLDTPERLLTGVLFWNLIVNLAYFTFGSIVSLEIEQDRHATAAGGFAFGSFLVIILFGEMLPKSLAVLQPRGLAALVAIPLAATVRVVSPLLPAFRMATLLAQRLLWPGFRPEPYLQIHDIERAVQLSTSDTALLEQEQRVLESIVQLSEVRAEELMRPRTQFVAFRPPVTMADLKGRMPSSGYLLVTEPDSDEVAAAIALEDLWQVPEGPLDRLAEPVIYVPWSTPAADVLELIRQKKREVAAVVNEFGETIGILTFDDILDTMFSGATSRNEGQIQREPIRKIDEGRWRVMSMTSVRRMARYFHVDCPPTKSVTIAGVVQELLERLPQPGDECRWGPFHLKVVTVPPHGQSVIELSWAEPAEEAS